MSINLNVPLEYISGRAPFRPEVGIILGSGLGALADRIENPTRIPYTEIPEFPQSTVEGHKGELIFGKISGKKVLAVNGRFHYYEGYTMNQVVAPVRIMALMGAHTLMVSNACGGVNPDFEIGDLMMITDHINLFPDNPLMGPNNDEWGRRFPDMSQTNDRRLREIATEADSELGIGMRSGVYAGLTGPCLETPAEYKYIRIIGADAVGMSTVPEVIAAHHMGMRCFGMSVITDLGVEGKIVETTHQDVVKVASETSPKMIALFEHMLKNL